MNDFSTDTIFEDRQVKIRSTQNGNLIMSVIGPDGTEYSIVFGMGQTIRLCLGISQHMGQIFSHMIETGRVDYLHHCIQQFLEER